MQLLWKSVGQYLEFFYSIVQDHLYDGIRKAIYFYLTKYPDENGKSMLYFYLTKYPDQNRKSKFYFYLTKYKYLQVNGKSTLYFCPTKYNYPEENGTSMDEKGNLTKLKTYLNLKVYPTTCLRLYLIAYLKT